MPSSLHHGEWSKLFQYQKYGDIFFWLICQTHYTQGRDCMYLHKWSKVNITALIRVDTTGGRIGWYDAQFTCIKNIGFLFAQSFNIICEWFKCHTMYKGPFQICFFNVLKLMYPYKWFEVPHQETDDILNMCDVSRCLSLPNFS